MKIIKSILGTIVLLTCTLSIQAQAPDWSVDSHDFLYSMTVTGTIKIDGVELADDQVMIGAFVGSECRGVTTLSFSADRYVAFLTIFGNASGEQVYFRVYIPESDQNDSLSNSMNFEINGSYGTMSNPYVFSISELSSEAVIYNMEFPEKNGETVFKGDSILIPVSYGTNQNSLIAEFSCPEGTKVFVNDTIQISGINIQNYSSPVMFEVLSPDETNWRSYIVSVFQANALPTDISLSNNKIDENTFEGKLIGIFETEDADNNPTAYFFISGTNDNEFFSLTDDSLFSDSKFDFEIKESYTIEIRTEDGNGGHFEKSFLININNLNEAPVIEDQFFSINENSESGTLIGTLSASDTDEGQLLYFTIITGNELDIIELDSLSGEITIQNSALFDYEKIGEIELLVMIRDNGSPIISDSCLVHIDVNDVIENTINCSNYISPNNDYINDYWVVKQENLYKDCLFYIFDSHGNIVLEQIGYENDWGGTYRGEVLPEGAYYFVIKDLENNHNYKGTITLVR